MCVCVWCVSIMYDEALTFKCVVKLTNTYEKAKVLTNHNTNQSTCSNIPKYESLSGNE